MERLVAGRIAIARTTFLGERPIGHKFEIIVEIGQPYRCGDSPDEWACPVRLEGLHDNLRDVHGGDAVQALCLAVRLAFHLLSSFKAEGGRLLFKIGEEVPLEAYVLKFTQ